jgi:glycyl-tRNA synthetase
MHPRVWEASGHVSGFTDPLIDCVHARRGSARTRWRARSARASRAAAPGEHDECALTEPRQFNLMFKTFMGPVEDSAAVVYLRPETAQGSYVNFLNVLNGSRQRVPFGIAQIGKAFRNEITPGNFIFRTREFEQMEMQFFVEPGTDDEWFEYWKAQRMEWVQSLGIRARRSCVSTSTAPTRSRTTRRRRSTSSTSSRSAGRSSRGCTTVRTSTCVGTRSTRARSSSTSIPWIATSAFCPTSSRRLSASAAWCSLRCADAYHEEEVEGEQRVVMRLHPRLAPQKVAVLPLVKKDGMPEMAERIHRAFRSAAINSFYDDSGSIGKRYRRLDEAGTPFALTVDGESGGNNGHVRDRDTLQAGADRWMASWIYIRQRIA